MNADNDKVYNAGTAESWRKILQGTLNEVYPVFADHNISFEVAMLLLQLREIENAMIRLTDAIGGEDDGDAWKQGDVE